MARIRTIKPEFWTHEDLSALPEATHMLAAALLNHADDEGYFNAHPGLVRAACCPLREPSVSVQDSLANLAKMGFIQVGTGSDGKRYGRIVKFDEHQRVNRPTHSKIKVLSVVWEDSSKTHTQLTEDSSPERNKEQGRERKGKEVSSLRSDSSSPSASTPAEPSTVEGATLSLVPPLPALAKHDARIERIAADAQSAYNTILAKPPGLLPLCAVINKPRRKAVEKALPTVRQICAQLYGSERVTPEFWRQYFETAAADDFHSGRAKGGPGHENWKPDFEFLLRETTIAKLFDRAMSEAQAA